MNISEVLSLYRHCRCRMLGAVSRSRQRQDRSFHFHDVPCASAMTLTLAWCYIPACADLIHQNLKLAPLTPLDYWI